MKRNSSLIGNTTKYGLIVDELRDAISAGRVQPDEQLPSESKMLERFNVAKNTLEKAYVILEQEGLIRRERGRGIFARSLAKNQKKETGFIGYVDLMGDYSNHAPYLQQVQTGMRQAAKQANKQLVLIDSPQTFTQWGDLDGLLLCEMGKIDRHELRRLFPPDLAVVNLLFDDPVFPSVVADDAMGSRLMVEHLISQGHQNIGYMGFYRVPPVTLRYQGYRETLLRNQVEPRNEWLRAPDDTWVGTNCKAGYYTMQRWLSEGFLTSGCTALLTQNDQMAFGVIRALQEADISFPGRISVAGFDGVPHAVLDGDEGNDEYWQPLQLTTIKVPLAEVAGVALKAVVVDGQIPPVGCPTTLPVELLIGESSSVVSGSCEVVCSN